MAKVIPAVKVPAIMKAEDGAPCGRTHAGPNQLTALPATSFRSHSIGKGFRGMDDFFLGFFALVLGLGVTFLGLRLFFIMLPIWGFIAGFYVGAEGFTVVFGDSCLSTVTGWVLGFFIGILFALLAFLFWYVGAIIAIGSVGATFGSGLMAAINVDTDWVVFLVAA